jgi:hypothetical protein
MRTYDPMEFMVNNRPMLRVLILDGDRQAWSERVAAAAPFELAIISETAEDLRPYGRNYQVSPRSLELARGAAPGDFDAVIIGNNEGIGLRKAHALHPSLRDITMIVWNRFSAEREPREAAEYREMGFTHFGPRFSHTNDGDGPGIWEFFEEQAQKLPTSVQQSSTT